MPTISLPNANKKCLRLTLYPVRSSTFEQSHGVDIFDYHRGHQTEIGGALTIFTEQPDITLIPGYSARAITSAGTLTAESFLQIADAFLAAARQAGTVDAIYLSLHGAMSVVDEPDPEGYLIAELRKMFR